MIDRVRVIERENVRLDVPIVTTLFMPGYISINISSTFDRQERPKKVTTMISIVLA